MILEEYIATLNVSEQVRDETKLVCGLRFVVVEGKDGREYARTQFRLLLLPNGIFFINFIL